MALIDDIRRQAQVEARLIDMAVSGFERELARVLRQVDRRVGELLRTLEASRPGRLVATRQSLARALRLRLELRTILEDAGFSALADAALADPLDRLTARVLDGRTLTGRTARLTNIDVDTLSAWRTIRQADLLEVGEDLTTAIWRATVDGIVAARDVDDLVGEVAELSAISDRRARTVYDTAVSTYSRHVDLLGVEPDPGDRFLYVGPDDAATRPFCRRHVGEVKTRAELDAIENGQLPNTLLTGGGWNCRHKWFFLADVEPEEVAA